MKMSMLIILLITIFLPLFNFIMINNFMNLNSKNINPMIMMMFLILFSIASSMQMSKFNNQIWISIFTFLIMIGGLMIIFMYFTSFISNVINSMKINSLKLILSKILFSLIFLTILWMNIKKFFMWSNNFKEIMPYNYLNKMNMMNFNSMTLYMYLYNKNYSLILVLIYLLSALIFIVKMIMKKKLTLRKINYEKINNKK
uniref:NADH dehydrogenase subunit 6 n=1 Tax=Encyrtus aurantii TaxID=2860127 RepID=A0AA50W6V4_9HYME|nr:NADH dehydrogenase subunit 6 [Encyrtus aurantii]